MATAVNISYIQFKAYLNKNTSGFKKKLWMYVIRKKPMSWINVFELQNQGI